MFLSPCDTEGAQALLCKTRYLGVSYGTSNLLSFLPQATHQHRLSFGEDCGCQPPPFVPFMEIRQPRRP